MFRIPLTLHSPVLSAPEPVYQAARWIRHFHKADFLHIGWDPRAGTRVPELLGQYGFIRIPRFELNSIRSLLKTCGPMLLCGAFSHLAQHEERLPIPEIALLRVSRYQDRSHAIVLNGYWDSFRPSLLYRDPAHSERQFLIGLPELQSRLAPASAIFYLNCPSFPKPCPHLALP